MAKLKNVTNEELTAVNDAIDTGQLWEIANRIEKMYVEEIQDPVRLAQSLLSLSRAAADVASKLLTVEQMQAQKAELAKLRQG